jgi:hypothetical protein
MSDDDGTDDEWMGEIRDDGPFHVLWSKAKDQPGYVKSEWMALERRLALRFKIERDGREDRRVVRVAEDYDTRERTERTHDHRERHPQRRMETFVMTVFGFSSGHERRS